MAVNRFGVSQQSRPLNPTMPIQMPIQPAQQPFVQQIQQQQAVLKIAQQNAMLQKQQQEQALLQRQRQIQQKQQPLLPPQQQQRIPARLAPQAGVPSPILNPLRPTQPLLNPLAAAAPGAASRTPILAVKPQPHQPSPQQPLVGRPVLPLPMGRAAVNPAVLAAGRGGVSPAVLAAGRGGVAPVLGAGRAVLTPQMLALNMRKLQQFQQLQQPQRLIRRITNPRRGPKVQANQTNTPQSKKPRFEEKSGPQAKRVVLHFDVNETIIVSDSAQNLTLNDTVNRIVAKQAWGRVEAVEETKSEETKSDSTEKSETAQTSESEAPKPIETDQTSESQAPKPIEPKLSHKWVAVSDTLSHHAPAEGLISYKEFVETHVYPWSRDGDTKELQKKQTELINKFVLVGQPGFKYRVFHDKLMQGLKLPAQPKYREFGDHHLLLPSFLKFVVWMQQQKREFRILFRTFGSDLPRIATEFNKFCEGKHPFFDNIHMDGTNGSLDRRLKDEAVGLFFRTSDEQDGVHLVLGSGLKAEHPSQDEFLQLRNQENSPVITGHSTILPALDLALDSHLTMGLRDHYDWWDLKDRHHQSGKLHLVDEQDYETFRVFFDDHVCDHAEAAQSIVDVRSAQTGLPIPLAETLDIYTVRVCTYQAVVDVNYFIKQFERAEAAFFQKLRHLLPSEKAKTEENGAEGEEEAEEEEELKHKKRSESPSQQPAPSSSEEAPQQASEVSEENSTSEAVAVEEEASA
eukprot:TRINITY_DN1782_c0_g1_i6.p1 TRINITY_DN1782_c0_g1~~TRINITY_DN1782_c0_g1_i6.p1  ORF type:complete len:808 (+),score=248.00 TRINITY_DN1782_c0_g1_i6:200-2425(+)